MRHISERLDCIAPTNARTNRHPRSRQDEPPIENPARLGYLLKLFRRAAERARYRKLRRQAHVSLPGDLRVGLTLTCVSLTSLAHNPRELVPPARTRRPFFS